MGNCESIHSTNNHKRINNSINNLDNKRINNNSSINIFNKNTINNNRNNINQEFNKSFLSNFKFSSSKIDFYFVLTTGEKYLMSSNKYISFKKILAQFISERCPKQYINQIKTAVCDANIINYNKTLSENNIKNQSFVLLIIDNKVIGNNYTNNNKTLIMKNINVLKKIKPKNVDELIQKIEKFFSFYINSVIEQINITNNLINDKNNIEMAIKNKYNNNSESRVIYNTAHPNFRSQFSSKLTKDSNIKVIKNNLNNELKYLNDKFNEHLNRLKNFYAQNNTKRNNI
jgi:hypothetical protein